MAVRRIAAAQPRVFLRPFDKLRVAPSYVEGRLARQSRSLRTGKTRGSILYRFTSTVSVALMATADAAGTSTRIS
jgi:hypothetical protein